MELFMELEILTMEMGKFFMIGAEIFLGLILIFRYDFEWQSVVPSIMIFDKTTDPSSPNLVAEMRLRRDGI